MSPKTIFLLAFFAVLSAPARGNLTSFVSEGTAAVENAIGAVGNFVAETPGKLKSFFFSEPKAKMSSYSVEYAGPAFQSSWGRIGEGDSESFWGDEQKADKKSSHVLPIEWEPPLRADERDSEGFGDNEPKADKISSYAPVELDPPLGTEEKDFKNFWPDKPEADKTWNYEPVGWDPPLTADGKEFEYFWDDSILKSGSPGMCCLGKWSNISLFALLFFVVKHIII